MEGADTTLIAIGGGDIAGAQRVLDEIFDRVEGEPDARMAVMTVATDEQDAAAQKYDRLFRKRSIHHVESVHINEREDAFAPSQLKKLERADVIFFTGGDQLHITSLLGGSDLHSLLIDKFESGTPIVGTSAGAAMMSATMITAGPNDVAPRTGCVEIAAGLDMIDGTVIDTDFAQRGRHGRLMTAVEHYPQILGIGIDEKTAIVVSGRQFKVVGEGSVTIVDGSKMKHANLVYTDEGSPIGLFDVCVHVLPEGYSFDLDAREPAPPRTKHSAGAGA